MTFSWWWSAKKPTFTASWDVGRTWALVRCMWKPSCTTCFAPANLYIQPTWSTGISNQGMFWSTVGARSSFVILDWQGAFLRTKTRIDAACPATSVPGGFGPQRSFWSRRNTEKEWTCGLLDASYTSWWHSQCSKKQTSTRRSNVCSEAAIATLFLRETKLLQKEPRTSSRLS